MEPSPESLALSNLLAKFISDADSPGSVAATVRDFIMELRVSAMDHFQGECGCITHVQDERVVFDKMCIGAHVVNVLKAAQNKSDPLFDGMDMLTRMQIQTGATTAIQLCK